MTTTTTVEPLKLRDEQDTGVAPLGPPSRLSALVALGPLAIGLAGAGMALTADGGTGPDDVVRFVLITAWAVAGTALVLSRRQVRVGVLVSGAATLAGLCSVTAEPSTVTDVLHPLALGLLPAAGFHLMLTLPSGVLVSAARRNGVWIAYGLGALVGLGLALVEGPPPWWPIIALGTGLAAVGAPVANTCYRTTRGLDRQRLQWIGLAVALSLEATLVVMALRIFIGWPDDWAEAAAASTAAVPIAFAVGASPKLVTRVDRLLVHAVSVAGLTAVVVAVYLVIVLGLGRAPDEDEQRFLVLSMAAAGVAGLLYLPARQRLADTANRLVYGEREAPDEVLRTFGTRLSRAIPMDELMLQLAESLRKTMALSGAEVWTGSAGVLERSVSVPDRPASRLTLSSTELPVVTRAGVSGNAWLAVWLPAILTGRAGVLLRVAPVAHSGELLGLIVAERSAAGDAFTEEEDRVLTELARQVALALHNVQLDSALQASLDEVRRQAEELRASRARIVAAGDAERRKIERNLHDGAQQHLVALAVNLRLAKDFVADDTETAMAMLDELAGSVKEAIAELRHLAHGIYPPLLVDSGIAEAMRAAAARSPLDVAVEAEEVGRHAPEVEAAVYFCCLEALQNAAKHAPSARVVVRVWEDPDANRLRFEVTDDGPGFDPAAMAHGQGLTNMSDRVGAVGGEVAWHSSPGQGTKVAGSIPRSTAERSEAWLTGTG